MVFKKLYNWIKFKTLPSSVLFKNRLYIERDSKHRRITSNLGLTFRNSKWSDYSLTNVSILSKNSFSRLVLNFLYLLLFLLISFSIIKYYNIDIRDNCFVSMWWWSSDLTSYWWSFFVANTLSFFYWFLSRSLNILYKFSFKNIFKDNLEDSNVVEYQQHLLFDEESKKLKVTVYLTWLTNFGNLVKSCLNNELNSNLQQSKLVNNLEGLYGNKTDSMVDYYETIDKLYRLSKSISASKALKIKSNDQKINEKKMLHINMLQNTPKNQTVFNITQDTNYNLKNLINKGTFNKNNWTSYYFNQEFNNYNSLISSKQGMFYFLNLDFKKINEKLLSDLEFTSFNNVIDNQAKTLKWTRWLYRYNILNRKIIQNSHNLTMTKKLITSGFYDSTMNTKNLWSSDFFKKNKNNNKLVSNLFNTLYGDIFTLDNNNSKKFSQNANFSTKNNLISSNFYENSYFFNLKKYYLFNTTKAFSIKSQYSNLNSNNQLNYLVNNLNNLNNKNNLLLFNLLQSNNLLNSYLNPTIPSNNLFTNKQPYLSVTSLQTKDIILLLKENDLLNIENLELLLNLTNSLDNHNQRLQFFNINNYDTTIMNTKLLFNSKLTPKKFNEFFKK